MTDRASVIEALLTATTNAMKAEAQRLDASAGDVGSAAVTFALRTIIALREMGANTVVLRRAVERILVECGDVSVLN